MKIFIQGRKKGYSVLYPFPTPDEFYNFARDVQSISAQNKPYFYGQSVYSLASSLGGRIYSKYVLGYDVQRSNLGNISFSVFVHDSKFISGASILALLDALSAKYFNTYAPDFFINEVQENWSLFTSIAEQYDAELHSLDSLDIEHLERGSQDPAFIYYSSRDQLASFFEDPYQKAYTPFSQIFFVETALKGKEENPLNALTLSPGAELTGMVDLENKKYRLIVNSSSYAKVDRIHSDGHRTPLYSNDRFHKKDTIFIKWSRQYYNSQEKSGTIEELKDYLDINELNRTVTVLPQNLNIITKDVQPQFLLKDESIKVDKFKCINSQNEEVKLQEDGILHFEGAQLVQTWTISASKGTTISIRESFVPEKAPTVFPLRASEEKKITFVFVNKETGERIHSVEIAFNDIHGKKKKEYGSIVFSNEEIDNRVLLAFKAKGYQTLEQYPIVPRNEHDEMRIELVPVPKREPVRWEGDLMPESSSGHHRPKRSWLRRNLIPLILGSLLAVSLFFNVLLFLSLKKEKAINMVRSATEYVEGPELLLSKLNEFAKQSAIKNDWSLNKRIGSACIQRGFIDASQFQIDSESWDKNNTLKQSPELLSFYQLCNDNKQLIGKMQDHLKEVWKDGIKDRPLKEITDTLRCYVELEKKKAAELEREIRERMSQVESSNLSQGETENTVQNEEPTSTDDNGASTLDGLTSEQKPSIFKRIFGKRKK